MPVLTSDMLCTACREIGLDKAPGEDGCTARCMDAWSSQAWDCVCGLLRVVEKTGRGPASLAGGLVCPLPKGGDGSSVADPLQARPVVLLAVLYRVWAKARSHYFEQWIKEEAGMQFLEESGAAREDLVVDLALAFVHLHPHAVKRCWVDDSTALVPGSRGHSLKLVLANTVAFEELDATDEATVNCAKSGYLASHEGAVKFIERILDARELWALGGVVALGDPGLGEPAWVTTAPQLARVEQRGDEEAFMAAARASVIVVGGGSFLLAEAWEVAAITGCYIWSGQWCDTDVPADERAVGQITKHGQDRRLQMSYRKTLKDLGAAQGLFKEAKDSAAKR